MIHKLERTLTLLQLYQTLLSWRAEILVRVVTRSKHTKYHHAAWSHFLLPGQPGRVSTETLAVQPDNFLLMTLHTMAFVRSCSL